MQLVIIDEYEWNLGVELMVGYGLDKYIDMDGYEDEGRMQG